MKMLVDSFSRADVVLSRGPTKNVRGVSMHRWSSSDKLNNRGMKSVIYEINIPIMSIGVPKIFGLRRNGLTETGNFK